MIKEKTVIKKDTMENWSKAKNFIPKEGEIIVYSDISGFIKMGDGVNKINDLPFLHNFSYDVNDEVLTIKMNLKERI